MRRASVLVTLLLAFAVAGARCGGQYPKSSSLSNRCGLGTSANPYCEYF